MLKQKIHSTTQDFTEIVDITDDIVFLKGKNACTVTEISSVNFFLLSSDEQNARIYGYMSLLNSLSFPIQIFIISRRVDLSTYIKLLDQKLEATQNLRVQEQLKLYKDFIQELIKGEGILDKKIYIVIPFSNLELGAVNATTGVQAQGQKKQLTYTDQVKSILVSKRNTVISQVERLGLIARPLPTEELAKLYYELFNQDFITLDFNTADIKNVIL